MRIKNIFSTSSIFIYIVLSFSLAEADQAFLKNFVPGKYEIVEGIGRVCRDEVFSVYYDGKKVMLGPHHLFNIFPESEVTPSGLSFEKGCSYYSNKTVKLAGRKTILRFEDALRCGNGMRYLLVETATITRSHVIVDVEKINGDAPGLGGPSYQYHCVWRRKT